MRILIKLSLYTRVILEKSERLFHFDDTYFSVLSVIENSPTLLLLYFRYVSFQMTPDWGIPPKVRQAEITFGKVISAERTGRLFYFSTFSGYVYKEK